MQKLRVGSSTFLSLDGGRIAANGIVSGASFQVHFLPRPCQPHDSLAQLASCAGGARAIRPVLCFCALAGPADPAASAAVPGCPRSHPWTALTTASAPAACWERCGRLRVVQMCARGGRSSCISCGGCCGRLALVCLMSPAVTRRIPPLDVPKSNMRLCPHLPQNPAAAQAAEQAAALELWVELLRSRDQLEASAAAAQVRGLFD